MDKTAEDTIHQRLDKLQHDLAACKDCQSQRYDNLVNKIDHRMDEFKDLLSKVAQGHAVMVTTQQEHEKKIQFLTDEWRRIVNERSRVEHTLDRVEKLLDEYDPKVMSSDIEKHDKRISKNEQELFVIHQEPGKKLGKVVDWIARGAVGILTGIVIWLVKGQQ